MRGTRGDGNAPHISVWVARHSYEVPSKGTDGARSNAGGGPTRTRRCLHVGRRSVGGPLQGPGRTEPFRACRGARASALEGRDPSPTREVAAAGITGDFVSRFRRSGRSGAYSMYRVCIEQAKKDVGKPAREVKKEGPETHFSTTPLPVCMWVEGLETIARGRLGGGDRPRGRRRATGESH